MMVPVLQKVTGGQATQTPKFMASEDFSEFQEARAGHVHRSRCDPEGQDSRHRGAESQSGIRLRRGCDAGGAKTLAAMTLEYLARP